MRQIANHFNKYFTNVGSQVDEIDTSNKQPFTSYLGPPCNHVFSFEYTTPDRVVKIIEKLKPETSSGPDGQSSKLLKAVGNTLAPTLSIIINQSLYSGIFPDRLKIAKVLPLYKKGENWLMENYRPISLLSTLSKVFERVVFEQLYEHLKSKKLLYQSQYGFRKDHSTELASVELIDHICKEMDKGDTPFSIFLDLSKAFDMLDHDILINKLKHYGINGKPLSWFKSYLTNRIQYVEIEGTSSNMLHSERGVPQGSILGPLLFIIFINDIYRSSNEFKFITYADDTTLFSSLSAFVHESNHNMQDASTRINGEIRKVMDWLTVNKLALNVNKTKFMVFHYHQRTLGEADIPNLKINGSDIERVSEFNFLGLTINEFMSWNSHSKKVSNKVSRVLGIMNRLKHFLPFSALRLMYQSLVNCHLQFCILAWGYECKRVYNLLKKAIRIMTASKYNAHTEPLFKQLNIMKIEDSFELQCLKFYHKFKTNTLPAFFDNIFTRNSDIHPYGTRGRDQLHFFPYKKTGASKCLRHSIPNLINDLSPNIRCQLDTLSLEGFSSYYKSLVINSYDPLCHVPNCYICNNS